jgi:hypothetical protein
LLDPQQGSAHNAAQGVLSEQIVSHQILSHSLTNRSDRSYSLASTRKSHRLRIKVICR